VKAAPLGTEHWIGPAALAGTLMLLMLHQVLSDVVRHAHERQLVAAPRATRSCDVLADLAQRSLCEQRALLASAQ
jgi:hypothetical protein